MDSRTLTIDQLCLSPFNARQRIPDEQETAILESLILLEGLRVPIECHPMRGSKTKWGAFAGRRRYFAIKRLIARGALPADYPVNVSVYTGASDAELVEMSLNENLPRRDMEDHELWAGVAKAARLGHDVAQIAAALAQTDTGKVAKWLRLGSLAKPVFDALVAGDIDVDQAQAYAGTEDRDLQAAVFGRLQPSARPTEIRRALKIGDSIARRHLGFVGEAIYRAAGGRYELDLFADAADDRGRVVDEGLLEKLVDEKMSGIKAQIRTTTARPDLRFVPAPPQTEQRFTDHQLAITPRRSDDRLVLPAGDVVAHIDIDAAGKAIVSYWWASRKAKFGSEKPVEVAPVSARPIGNAIDNPVDHGRTANAAVHREEGISQDATFALRSVRKAILRAALVNDAEAGGEVALDYLVFVQVRALLEVQRPAGLGMRTIAGDNMVGVSADAMAKAREQVELAPASRTTGHAIALIKRQPFFTEPNIEQAFLAFVNADPIAKRTAAALVAGVALERSLAADGFQSPIHDVVAHLVDADRDDAVRRRYWTPTAELLDFFPKDQRRAIAEPFVDRATFANWAKLTSKELTGAVLGVLTRAGGKGATWVHPLLRFTSPFLGHRLAAKHQVSVKEAAE